MISINDLKIKYKTASNIERLIAINVLAFVLLYGVRLVAFLFSYSESSIESWLFFSKSIGAYVYKPWTIITYAFLHGGLWHLLSNMIVLYFSGHYFITYFTAKRTLTVYLLGAISGALVFMGAYNLFPAFTSVDQGYLVGASASVMAILVAVATYVPNLAIRMLFLGSIKFWWIACFFILLDIVQIPLGTNSGGHLAHLGGALFGYVYASQFRKGKDIGAGFERFLNTIESWFQPKSKSPLRTVYKKDKTKSTSKKKSVSSTSRKSNQAEIDSILDKIGQSGYESLTKKEKEFLFQAGKE